MLVRQLVVVHGKLDRLQQPCQVAQARASRLLLNLLAEGAANVGVDKVNPVLEALSFVHGVVLATLSEVLVVESWAAGALQCLELLLEVGVLLEELAVQCRRVLQLVDVDVADLLEEVLLELPLPLKILRGVLQLFE